MKPSAATVSFLLVGVMMPAWFFLTPVVIQPGPVVLPRPCGAAASEAMGATLAPAATGTVADYPRLGLRVLAPVGEDMQSSYFRTTETNLEFRRGFAEFAIPRFGAEVRRATFTFAEGPGVTLPGNPPPVSHELSWYLGDLRVTVEDYGRSTALLAHFEDDLTDPNSVWSFDVTQMVRETQGGCLGFRMKLTVDPEHAAYGSLGTSFGRYVWQPPEIRLDFV